MLEILTLAQRMISAGLDETEVAAGLVNYLKGRYNLTEGETYHDPQGLACDSEPLRLVCRNTFQHTMPEFSFKDEPWHNK
jgi:hypothetical protein